MRSTNSRTAPSGVAFGGRRAQPASASRSASTHPRPRARTSATRRVRHVRGIGVRLPSRGQAVHTALWTRSGAGKGGRLTQRLVEDYRDGVGEVERPDGTEGRDAERRFWALSQELVRESGALSAE